MYSPEGAAAVHEDGWENAIIGLGGAADKRKFTHAKASPLLSDTELENIYMDDGLSARIVDLVPDDMFRKGWEFEFDDVESEDEKKVLAQVYIDAFDALNVKSQLNYGHKWARLYGGSLAIIGAVDGRGFDKEIVPKSIKEWDEIRIVDRSDLDFSLIKFQMDPLRPRYLKPEFYTIQFETGDGEMKDTLVHWSRVIELHGKAIPQGESSRLDRERRYWGLSYLQAPYELLKTIGGVFGSLGNLLHEFSVGKYKLKDLVDILTAPDGEKAVQKRIEAMDLMQSAFHSIFLDVGEDFVRESVSFAGVSDVVYQFFMILSAEVGVPISRLFGVTPAGLNSTGEGDMQNYQDVVEAAQETQLAPGLRYLVHLIAEKEGKPEPNIIFNPLKQMTEKEVEELDEIKEKKLLAKAQRYQAFVDMGVMEAYQVEAIEFGDSLEKIPAPKELKLPPVVPAPVTPSNVLPTKTPDQIVADKARIAALELLGNNRTSVEEEEYQDLLAQAKVNGQS
jgi:phage-related protein (TIGR01555 family)